MNVTAGYAEAMFVPIVVVSEANRSGHWSRHHARHKAQRMGARQFCKTEWDAERIRSNPLLTVHLVRVGGRKMDSDNLASAFKHVRDGIADFLQIDDGSDRVQWTYSQRPKRRNEQAGTIIVIAERAA